MSFKRSQRGQILPLVIFGAVPMVLMIVLLLNTGSRVSSRIQVQNAVDAAALSQASWTARGMNVMAMNNVAITQSLAITVITGALIPVIGEMYVQAGVKMAQYVQAGLACAGTGPAIAACIAFWAARAENLTRKVIIPLRKKFKIEEITKNTLRFERITRALGRMNQNIDRGFTAFARQAGGDLAAQNGVGRDGIRFYAGWQPRGLGRADSTELPVSRGGLSGAGLGGGAALSSLCSAGKSGTSATGIGGRMQYRNFQEHGYATGTGPYTHGRDGVWSRLRPPYNALRYKHQAPLVLDFKTAADLAWEVACNGVGLSSIYNVKKPLSVGSLLGTGVDRQHFSLLAFGRMRLPGARLLPRSFPGGIDAVYAYAQAELYNPHNYDLYSQSWRARLAPAKLITEANRSNLSRTVRDFPRLSQVLTQVGSTGLQQVNAH